MSCDCHITACPGQCCICGQAICLGDLFENYYFIKDLGHICEDCNEKEETTNSKT